MKRIQIALVSTLVFGFASGRTEFADLNVGGDCYRMDERLLRFLTHLFGSAVTSFINRRPHVTNTLVA